MFYSRISNELAKDLGLKSIGSSPLNTASGLRESLCYEITLNISNDISITDLFVYSFSRCRDIDILIGLDVICKGDFSITNANGKLLCLFLSTQKDKY